MSLVSQAIAVTVTELLTGATWAQDWVVKQPIDPIVEVLRTDGPQRPMLAVYVENAKFNVEGRASSGTDGMLEVKVFVYVAPGRMTLSIDTAQFTLDSQQAGLTLDIVGRQVDQSFHLDNQWVAIWNRFVPKIISRDVHYMLVEVEGGVKVPTMEICYKVQSSPDPQFLLEELPHGWAMLDTALRAGSADKVKLADLFRSQIIRGADIPDYQWLMQNFGLTPEGLDSTGLGPQDLLSVDENGNTPLLQSIAWFASSALWPPLEGIDFRGFSYGGATVFGDIFIPGDGNLIGNLASSAPTAIGGLSLAAFLGGSGSSAPPLAQGGVSIEGAFAAFVGSLPPGTVATLVAAVSLAGTSGTVSADQSGAMTRAISFIGSSSGTAVQSGSIDASVGLYGSAAAALAAAAGNLSIAGLTGLQGNVSSAQASASGAVTAATQVSGATQSASDGQAAVIAATTISGTSASAAASETGGITASAPQSGSSASAPAGATGGAAIVAAMQGSVSSPAASGSGTTTRALELQGSGPTTAPGATGAAAIIAALQGSVSSTAASQSGSITAAALIAGSSSTANAGATGVLTQTSSGSTAAFRSVASTTYASRSNTAVNAPAGVADGDIVIIALFQGISGGTPPTLASAPAGFTQIGTAIDVVESGSVFNARFSLWWKRAASEGASYTFTHTSNNTQAVAVAISGAVSSGSPVDVSSSNFATGTPPNTTATANSVTTTVANDLLIYVGFNWDATGTLTAPTGMTERFDGLVYFADVKQAAAGASGNKTQTLASQNPWGACLVAIK